MWGKLAAEILMQNWDNALDDFNRLKEFIDSNVSIVTSNILYILFSELTMSYTMGANKLV